LTRRPVSRKVSLIGKMTLTERLFPVGGLKERMPLHPAS
jgi:ATP-dependent Lon protease